jgi:hypothetical protein
MVGSDFATRLMARMDMALWGAVTTNVERYMGVSMQNIQRGAGRPGAFSGEVDTGSLLENATNATNRERIPIQSKNGCALERGAGMRERDYPAAHGTSSRRSVPLA